MSSVVVRAAVYNRMPPYVTQTDETVRVFRNAPDRVKLQIRNPKHYMTASLTSDEAAAIANMLLAAAAEATSSEPVGR
jgi:hypothetical protein